jgi:hypothetical protein
MTFDFIFALTLTLGFTALFAAFALTLSAVETLQYVAFASSRVYYGSHISQKEQRQLAELKFTQLRKTPGIGVMINPAWFDLKLKVGDFSSEYNRTTPRDIFEGAYIDFSAKLLAFSIPFFGSTTNDEDGFSARVTSFLGREPTSEECQNFNQQRVEALLKKIGNGELNTYADPKAYVPIADNGC